MPLSLEGQSVVVTGASSGLGRAMALQLARDHRANVIAVARRADLLATLASDAPGSSIQPHVCDLSNLEEAAALIKDLQGTSLKAAILNAGITLTGPYQAQSWEHVSRLIDLNIKSTSFLAQALLGPLQEGQGALMIVTSLGGRTPLPFQAAYGASKAYLTHLGLALAREVRPHGPSITVFAPGGIDTAMTQGPAFDNQRGYLMPVDTVAQHALAAMCAGKTLVTPGVHNKLMSLAIKCLPQPVITAVLDRQFRRDMS